MVLNKNTFIGEAISNNFTFKKYDSSGTLLETQSGSYSSQVIGFEDVTVPAGSFTGCLHLNFRFLLPNEGENRIDVWLAQNIGIVKETHFEQDEFIDSLSVLFRYSVENGTRIGQATNVATMMAQLISVTRQRNLPSPGEFTNLFIRVYTPAGSSIVTIDVSGPGVSATLSEGASPGKFLQIFSNPSGMGVNSVYNLTAKDGSGNVVATMALTVMNIPAATTNSITVSPNSPTTNLFTFTWNEIVGSVTPNFGPNFSHIRASVSPLSGGQDILDRDGIPPSTTSTNTVVFDFTNVPSGSYKFHVTYYDIYGNSARTESASFAK